jgi:hypothetical protein
MKTRILLSLLALAWVTPAVAQSLPAFRSDAELARYLRQIERRQRRAFQLQNGMASLAPGASAEMSITNAQHAGVDEGGIVKLHGEYLVMLRRGRLFTVAVSDGRRQPVAAVDAFGPGIEPGGNWYDELIIAGDKVVVIGYSYERGGTELGVFRIDAAGGLRHLSTYQLRSNDYYSSRNYASRLIGTKLVFYTPLYLWDQPNDPLAVLPALRRWSPARDDSGRFVRTAPAWRVYRTGGSEGLSDDAALHTVTMCELDAEPLSCESTVVIGPSGRVFYVSGHAVYVWMSSWDRNARRGDAPAKLVRMPLDGSHPTALGVAGTPVDQFSFLESSDGYLNVLVRSEAHGDAMWAPEVSAGDAALLRVPLRLFGDGSERAHSWRYRPLPAPQGYSFVNRFVGDYVLYGLGNVWQRPTGDTTSLYVVPWRGGPTTRLELPHRVDRIEVMGAAAAVIGTGGRDLYFSGIHLNGRVRVRQRYVMPDASQGETRSHGFFYRRDGHTSGVLGLPVRGGSRPGYEHLIHGSASIVFLQDQDGSFEPLGELRAAPVQARMASDGCRASCVDWYGNARPIFLGGRVFALLGYELVEGTIRGARLEEIGRADFTPGVARTASY